MRLLKLVQKALLVSLLLLGLGISPQKAYSQIRMDGPKETQVGKVVRINISGVKDLNDPKIRCFPENDQWEAVQRLDGSPILLFFPEKNGLYTFIVAGNKDNKTIFEVFQVHVGPGPGPGGKYTSKLTSPYMVNPDNTSLAKLVSVYASMAQNAAKMTSYKQVNDALAVATKAAIGETALRGVRDAVADILMADLANRNSTRYDPAATAGIFDELARSLVPLLEK